MWATKEFGKLARPTGRFFLWDMLADSSFGTHIAADDSEIAAVVDVGTG